MSQKSRFDVVQNLSSRKLVSRILAYARPYRGRLIVGFISMLLVAVSTAATAKLMKPVINDIFISKRADLVLPITAAIITIFFTKGLFTYIESVNLAFVGNRIMTDIQNKLFGHLIFADMSFYHAVQTGDLVSRFNSDVGKLNSAVTGTLSNIGKDFFTLIFFIYVMFDEDWQLSCVVFFILPLALFPLIKIGRSMRKVSKKIQEKTADVTILITQAFQGIRLIKSYCLEKYEIEKIAQALGLMFERTLKGVKTKAASHPIMEFLGGCAVAAVIFYGGSQVISGTQTPGAFFAFITALLMSYEPLKRLTNLNANLQEQLAAAERVFALMDRKPVIVESQKARNIEVKKGTISFDHVTFSYEEGHVVLNDICLDIPSGKKVALVGPSGGGKSTLMNMILRFYDPNKGSILIDGHKLEDFTTESLRHNIALVSQEVVLFDDTIRANIAYGNPQATEAEIITAAQSAAAHEFIMGLPQGYDTYVGEQGLRLSGGQRQRISIARAFLKNAPILCMDEPTSALDSESEKVIQDALKRLMKGRTNLIIAHRLATIRDADEIIVLEDGQITAQGPHAQLLLKSKKYKELCRLQFQEAQS